MHPYEALSYVWGDEKMRANILCDGQIVSVALSLFDALKRLRLPQESRFIWADALCINQNNSSEKSCQIPLMGKIYSMAVRVVVWLGTFDLEPCKGDLETVKLMAKQIRSIGDDIEPVGIDWKEHLTVEMMPSEYTGEATKKFLQRLYATPWFYRVWCIQEITLARDAVILLGELELQWEDVGQIALWLLAIADYDDNAYGVGINYLNAFFMYGTRLMRGGLLKSLVNCREFQATDPRDKVYGILAVVEPAEEARALCVDYNKGVDEVYADAAVALIRLHSDLEVLAHVNHGSEYCSDGAFTSWAPQWNKEYGLVSILSHSSPLSACRNAMVHSVDASDINSQYLRLKGLLYSATTIVHVEMDRNNMFNHEEHPFFYIVVAILGQQFPDDDEAKRVSNILARTLAAGHNSSLENIVTASEEQQDAFYGSFMLFIHCLKNGTNFWDHRKYLPTQESFYKQAEGVCLGRRFFQMENGTFGIGPACMREGDIVVVLFGQDAPCVLRPFGTSYLFMGTAYVDALRNGELVDEMDAGRIEEQEFVLV
jgi:hypothetical protein